MIEKCNVFLDQAIQMILSQDQEVVETLCAGQNRQGVVGCKSQAVKV